jgi:hypothetical protein
LRTKEESKKQTIQKVEYQRICGMDFDTSATKRNEFLLLPEESCLAEDEKSILHVHCEREGFHLFGWGDVNFNHIQTKIYLTNYRVIFPLRPSLIW